MIGLIAAMLGLVVLDDPEQASDAEIAAFIEETESTFPFVAERRGYDIDLENYLIEAVLNAPDRATGLSAFADAIDVDFDTAARTADLVIRASAVDRNCGWNDEACMPENNAGVRELVVEARDYPNDDQVLEFLRARFGRNSLAFTALTPEVGLSRRDALERFRDGERSFGYVAAALGARSNDFYTEMLRESGGRTGLYMAFREQIRDRLARRRDGESRTLYWYATRQLISRAVGNHQPAIALGVYREYADSGRRDFWFAPERAFAARMNISVDRSNHVNQRPEFDLGNARLAIGLAGLALQEGDRELALELIEQAEASLALIPGLVAFRTCYRSDADVHNMGLRPLRESLDRADYLAGRGPEHDIAAARVEIDFLREYMAPMLDADMVFDRLLIGMPADEAIALNQRNAARIGETLANSTEEYPELPDDLEERAPPWLNVGFRMAHFSVSDRLKRDYLVQMGLGGLADAILPVRDCRSAYGEYESFEESFPESALLTRALEIENALPPPCETRFSRRVETEPAELPNPRPGYFTEHAMAFAPDVTAPNAANAPARPALTTDHQSIVRAEFDGQEWTAIYLSRALDPAGEVSAGGYWIVRTENGGAHWGSSYYLGLQEHFPYVIEERSSLPLADGDIVRIAARIEAIDRSSITFPPVALRVGGGNAPVYLEFAWEDVMRDQDGDGLTDLLEHRIALDYLDPDTDGDGIADGQDMLPTLQSRTPPMPPEFMSQLIAPMLGSDTAALIVEPRSGGADVTDDLMSALNAPSPSPELPVLLLVAGDGEAFERASRTSIPIVVHPQAVYEALNAEYGATYPFQILSISESPTGNRWLVEWTARWVGGSFAIVRTENGFEAIEVSSWIT